MPSYDRWYMCRREDAGWSGREAHTGEELSNAHRVRTFPIVGNGVGYEGDRSVIFTHWAVLHVRRIGVPLALAEIDSINDVAS